MRIRHVFAFSMASVLLISGAQALAANEQEQKETKRVPSMMTGKKSDTKKAQTQQPAADKATQTAEKAEDKKQCFNRRGEKVDC